MLFGRLIPALFTLALLAACGAPAPDGPVVTDKRETLGISFQPPTKATAPDAPGPALEAEIVRLTAAIQALGPGVDPQEAARAARVSLEYPLQLRREYGVTDSALIHNTKVNMGLRPRGLCWHWAEDMEIRLRAENFQTLDIHRAIANSDVSFRIDHSTSLISAKGDDMYHAIVVDPWRWGGKLWWGPPQSDKSYKWRPQAEVHAEKARKAAREARFN